MRVAQIAPIGVKYNTYNVQNSNKVTFLGTTRDTFIRRDPEFLKFQQAYDRAQNANWYKINHAHGNFLDKLEGLQYGLKSFHNVPIKEIYHIMKRADTLELALIRGCKNGCKHCYVGAKPPIKEDDKHISRMSFENFDQFASDFGEMKKRLKMHHPNSRVVFFRDSDSKDIYLRDKQGNIHPYHELNKIFHQKTGLKSIFDTAGWDAKDSATQKRMDEMVDYYAKAGKMGEIYRVNISLNPFGKLMQQANALAQKGEIQESKAKRAQYVKNMANVFFTFTPLIKNKKFSVIGLALPYSADKQDLAPYNAESYNSLMKDILRELKKMYFADFYGEQKRIIKKSQIEPYIKEVRELCVDGLKTKIGKSGHDNDFYCNDLPERVSHKDVRDRFNTFIDTNGEVYLTLASNLFKTTTKLNFKDRHKETMQVRPEPKETIDVKKFYPS